MSDTVDECIAVRLTASGAAAIAVILVVGGGGVPERVAPCRELAVGDFSRVAIRGVEGALVDDALLVRVEAGAWELHVHGGVAVVEAVLGALAAEGVRVISLEEARGLGLLGEGIDGELQCALPGAVTESALRLLVPQAGRLGEWIERRRAELSGPLWRVQSAAQWLLNRSESLRFLLEPARVALIGPPNAGKSTLANALLGRPVSITSSQAGTTRDWVDAAAVFTVGESVSVPVVLVDTAGVRETGDALERESIVRTHGQAGAADVVVVVLDATRAVGAEELALVERYQGRLVVVINKVDASGGEVNLPEPWRRVAVRISALHRMGLDGLMAAVLARLGLQAVGEEGFAFSARQRDLLRELAEVPDASRAADCLERLERWP